MTPEQKAQEERWAKELRESQLRFKARLEGALLYWKSKTKRRAYYIALKAEIGDQLSKEIARFAEGVISGSVKYPKWLQDLPDGYVDVPRV